MDCVLFCLFVGVFLYSISLLIITERQDASVIEVKRKKKERKKERRAVKIIMLNNTNEVWLETVLYSTLCWHVACVGPVHCHCVTRLCEGPLHRHTLTHTHRHSHRHTHRVRPCCVGWITEKQRQQKNKHFGLLFYLIFCLVLFTICDHSNGQLPPSVTAVHCCGPSIKDSLGPQPCSGAL